MGRNAVNATSGTIIPRYANFKVLVVVTQEDRNQVKGESEEELRRQLRTPNPQVQMMNFSDRQQNT